jgi:UDP-N-acetylglucosamine--N-acetylmuramyl-(pentapeptide) pyrophosphoryl-undecaprenol N-acetylglucosamine transferase
MSTLLVAATGGHLKQLHLLRQRLDESDGPYHWVTFDKAQSRSLLRDEECASVDFVPFIGSRDPRNAVRGLYAARRLLRKYRPDRVISTGSAIALPYMLLGRLAGARCTYIESAARCHGPSLTGRMIARIPGVELRTQHERWADERWRYEGSVFDSFVARSVPDASPVTRVVVTLGTLEFDFSRLVDRVWELLGERDVEILWQTGGTQLAERIGTADAFLPEAELHEAMRAADVVIAHAGVGSALGALEAGKCPVLVPRRASSSEHVDDHQEQIAGELGRRGLAIVTEADTLSHADLIAATERSVVGYSRRSDPSRAPDIRARFGRQRYAVAPGT